MIGSVRVVSKRWSGTQPEAGETVVDCDRDNPVLGNRHHMREKSLSERERVIAANTADLDADLEGNGPKTQASAALARRAAAGENLALRCWCAPAPCHVDEIAVRVRKLAKQFAQGQVHGEG